MKPDLNSPKVCDTCHLTMKLHLFTLDGSSSTGRTDTCMKCSSRLHREANSKRIVRPYDSTKGRKHMLMAKYGLTLDDYDSLYEEQEGVCAICMGEFDTLVVDHCHATGAVRGLLCSGCNSGLGFFKDSADSLLRAIEYLDN